MSSPHRIIVGTEYSGAEVLKNLLTLTDGYELIFAQDAADLLKAAHSKRPDLIVCDIVFDESAVFRVIRAVREDQDLQDIPFICTRIQGSRMPESLVSSFELLFKQLSGCTYIDLCALQMTGEVDKFVALVKASIQRADTDNKATKLLH